LRESLDFEGVTDPSEDLPKKWVTDPKAIAAEDVGAYRFRFPAGILDF